MHMTDTEWDKSLIGSEVKGRILADRYTDWQEFENGDRAARFHDTRKGRMLVWLIALANGETEIDGFRI
jgi:hypothetical protein